MQKILSKSSKDTQKKAGDLARKILRLNLKKAVVVALEGELGSGKTTFSQGFAKALGVKERVLSPTFVLLKIYKIKHKKFKHLIHIDCYRLDSAKDLLHLGFKDLLKDKDAIILIEWAERIFKILPKSAFWIKFNHTKFLNKRKILVL